MRTLRHTPLVLALAAAALWFSVPSSLRAQARGGAGAAQTPKAAAPIDLTGYWVAIITEDWRYRMMVPAPGDFPSVPLNAEGRRIALAWDPVKDEAAGNQCGRHAPRPRPGQLGIRGRPGSPTGAASSRRQPHGRRHQSQARLHAAQRRSLRPQCRDHGTL
jgi:hypothetical protein